MQGVTAFLFLALAAAGSAYEPVFNLHTFDVLRTPGRSLIEADPACPGFPETFPLPRPLPNGIKTALDAFESAVLASVNGSVTEGVSAAISYRGQTLSTVVSGFANRSSGKPVTENTLFRIGSVTKVFSALLVYISASAGELDLDAPVSSSVPEFSVVNPFGTSEVTWRQLLEQRSGLQREAPAGISNTTEALEMIGKTMLIHAPGGIPSYSNLGFALAGNLVAERVVGQGMTFTSLVQKRILDPLGLKNTGNTYDGDVLSQLAVPYAANGEPYSFYDLGWADPAGSMYSTPSDLAVVADAIMQAAAEEAAGPLGSSLSQEFARQALNPTYWNPDGITQFGAPWEMRTHGATLVRRKGGNLPGFSTLLSFVPELRLAITTTWNWGQSEFDQSKVIWDAVLSPWISTMMDLQPSPFSPGPTPQDYVGKYTSDLTSLQFYAEFNVTGNGGFIIAVPGVISIYANDVAALTSRNDTFQTYFPPAVAPCLTMELLAYGNQYVFFSRDSTGEVVSASIPGIIPGLEFSRQAV